MSHDSTVIWHGGGGGGGLYLQVDGIITGWAYKQGTYNPNFTVCINIHFIFQTGACKMM